MNQEALKILLSFILLTIIFIIIVLIILENYSSFKEKIKTNKLDKRYKKELQVRKKDILDTRYRSYKFVNNNINITLDASNHNNPYDSKYTTINEYFYPNLDKNNKNSKARKITKIIFSVIFYIIVICLLALGIYTKANNELLTFGNKTYITITTGSMSEVNEYNDYLISNNLTNQIPAKTLIGLDKVTDPSSLEVYDVAVYKDKETNMLIVHRIISESYIDGERYFTFRGDANPVSDYYLVSEEDVLYTFDGFMNKPLGYFFTYMTSYQSIISIVYIVLALNILESYDKKKDKLYYDNLENVISRLNQEEINKLGNIKYIEI